MPGRGRPPKPEAEKAPHAVPNKWKEGGRGRPPGRKRGFNAFISFKKQNTQAALDFKKKTGN